VDDKVLKEDKKKLLAVFAHPDDESFGPGGTLALYARRGVEIHLICATRGEAGKIPEALAQSYQTVAQLREAELRCAATQLGLTEIHFLDYRDSGMAGSPDNHHPAALAAAPLEDVAEKITHLIRRIQPQVVLTHDPKGGYLHPDHIAIHNATVEAFHAAGDRSRFTNDLPVFSPEKLYYTIFPMKFLRFIIRLLPILGIHPRRFGKNHDIDLMELVEVDYPVHARIDIRSVIELKDRASACHASQVDDGFQRDGILGWIIHRLSIKETFMRAYPPVADKLRENDLFADVGA
jgi:LmbE family N-acetylglucosaminyl deacetylase